MVPPLPVELLPVVGEAAVPLAVVEDLDGLLGVELGHDAMLGRSSLGFQRPRRSLRDELSDKHYHSGNDEQRADDGE